MQSDEAASADTSNLHEIAVEQAVAPQVSDELIQKMLHQREVRLRSKYAYQKRKYREDAEHRKKLAEKRLAHNNKRYAEDPVYAEKVRKDRRERYARQKQLKQQESLVLTQPTSH